MCSWIYPSIKSTDEDLTDAEPTRLNRQLVMDLRAYKCRLPAHALHFE
jgi:hypothetical protein